MMDGVALGGATKRGVKRQLADESNDELRFTKRFNLLSIGRCYHGFAAALKY